MASLQILARKLTARLYSGDSFVRAWRSERWRSFLDCVSPPPGARILDIGGTPYMWGLGKHDFKVTILNLPGTIPEGDRKPGFAFVEADATDLTGIYRDRSFDVVYSNSVIEHVGAETKQEEFAREVRRLAPAYWVQTPSDRFFLEVHTGVPFYWDLPARAREQLVRGWRKRLPAWTSMIDELRVLSRSRMRRLFPDGRTYIERRFLFEKSYCFYRAFPGA